MGKSYVYRSISDDLRAAISSGIYAPDEMIPSENLLVEKYNTTRLTVRKALQVLESENLIRPQQGKGYFVLSPEYSRFELNFVDKPDVGAMKYLEINVIPAGEELSARLQVQEDTMLVVVRRLFLEEDEPASYDEKYFLYMRGEPLIERELHYSQFPDLFTDKYVPRKIWTDMEISAGKAPENVAGALQCAPGETLLLVTRTVFSDEDVPIGFGQRWYAPGHGKLGAVSNRYVLRG